MRYLLLTLLALPFAAEASASDALAKYALKLVNRERARMNLPALKADDEIAKYAETRARELLAGKEDGLTPYMRWSFRGEAARVSENVAGWSVSYQPTEHILRELVRQSHETMMAEEPPLHGRRSAILDPHATHIGIAVVWEGGQFRLVENIVRRYVELTQPLPREAKTADTLAIAGRTRGQAVFDSITVHYEPLPDASAKSSDGLPAKRKEYLPKLGSAVTRDRNGNINYERYQYAENRFGEIDTTKDGAFSVSVPFTEGPGIYTIVVWVTIPDFVHPFATTNVSVRVEESAIVNMLPIR